MTSAPARLYDTDSMEQVMRTFDDTKAEHNVPDIVQQDNANQHPFLIRHGKDIAMRGRKQILGLRVQVEDIQLVP